MNSGLPQPAIAHYRITSKLGQGGMGAVYRATDTKLNREVAIKVLPDAFAADPDRMARFAREAQVLASLNHPNIAAIYGVENRALIMELAEGPTLAERIAEGAIPLEEALAIARQIAGALEYAHEKNIVHRDLKPANIKITPEGRVKVLDFGLAKALAADSSAAADPMSSPTLTMRATQAGTIMGTAGYMAPEQARGQAVDQRADIWAFGVVLYEMLTGEALFAGPTVSDTLAAVLTREADWRRVPAQVQRLLKSCLEKDSKRRLRHIGDAWRLLEETPAAAPVARRAGNTGWKAFATILTLVALAASFIAWRVTRPVLHPLTRLSVDLGPDAVSGSAVTVAISPDGRRVAFPVQTADGTHLLATRLLDQAQPTLLSGTDSSYDPFFSPDSQWIGFFAGGALKKIAAQGGAPVMLTPVSISAGASWGDDGNIILATSRYTGLVRIPAAGGTPQRITKPAANEMIHRWPQVLPGAKAVLFTASSTPTGMDDAEIEAADLKTGAVTVVQRGGYYGRYLPSGHLVYLHQGVLFAEHFDPLLLQVRGDPVPVVEDIAGQPMLGGGQFDFSAGPGGSGTFVYLAGKVATEGWSIVWLDSSGKTQPLISTPGTYFNPTFSPDGRHLAFDTNSGKGLDIFVYGLARQTMTRLTFDGNSDRPVWTPDGQHITFMSSSPGHAIWWTRSDGSEQPQLLLKGQDLIVPWSISPDGRRLAYWETNPETNYDIGILPLDLSDPDHPKPGKPEPFLRTPAREYMPAFSPDGRWIAYFSDESGTGEVYVRSSSGEGGKWQISNGGMFPVWAPKGHELFYETPDARIMAVDYTATGSTFVPGKPRLWCNHAIYAPGRANLDITPDGKRFAVFQTPESGPSTPRVVFLLNFLDELRRRLP